MGGVRQTDSGAMDGKLIGDRIQVAQELQGGDDDELVAASILSADPDVDQFNVRAHADDGSAAAWPIGADDSGDMRSHGCRLACCDYNVYHAECGETDAATPSRYSATSECGRRGRGHSGRVVGGQFFSKKQLR